MSTEFSRRPASFLSLAPARRMRSLESSAIVLNPADAASDLVSVCSASCTMMNLRVPPSPKLASRTACAIDELPAKKSSTMPLESQAISRMRFMRSGDFGKSIAALPSSDLTDLRP